MCQQLADEIQDLLDAVDVDSASESELRSVVEQISDLVAGEEDEDEDDEDDEDDDEDDIEVEEEEERR